MASSRKKGIRNLLFLPCFTPPLILKVVGIHLETNDALVV